VVCCHILSTPGLAWPVPWPLSCLPTQHKTLTCTVLGPGPVAHLSLDLNVASRLTMAERVNKAYIDVVNQFDIARLDQDSVSFAWAGADPENPADPKDLTPCRWIAGMNKYEVKFTLGGRDSTVQLFFKINGEVLTHQLQYVFAFETNINGDTCTRCHNGDVSLIYTMIHQ
jgi:hypothetical protein